MSFYQTIRKLNNSQTFVGMLDARVTAFSREIGAKLEYNDQSAREIAQQWRQILRTKFEFEEADFNVLIDEVIGELVGLIATAPALLTPIPNNSRDQYVRALVSYASEYLALDMAITILKRVFRGEMNLVKPTPQRILEACVTLRQNPHSAHRYWTWLGLRLEEVGS